MRAHNVLDNRNSVGGGDSSVSEGKASVGQASVGIDGYIGISLPLDCPLVFYSGFGPAAIRIIPQTVLTWVF